MAVRYFPLATDDPEDARGELAFDFSSTFRGDSYQADKYKSIFKYGKKVQMDSDVAVVKQSFGSWMCGVVVTVLSIIFCVLTFPCSAWISFKKVSEGQRMVVFRLGRLDRVKGPGIVFVVPCIDVYKVVDTRIKAFNVPPLQILTADGGIIEMGADVYYQITDVVRSVTAVQDMNNSIRMLVRTGLMNHMVKLELQEIEATKTMIIHHVLTECNKTSGSWGLDISRMEFSPIKVLQNPQGGSSLPPAMLQGQALPNTIQQLAQAFMTNTGPPIPSPTSIQMVSETREAASGAVGSEDVTLVPAPRPKELLQTVRGVLSESLVHSIKSTYQFNLSGENGGTFYVDLKHGSGKAGEGPEPSGDPDVTLDLSVEDMQQMFTGQLKPMSAYMSGRLQISGDLSAAMDLKEIIRKVKTLNKSGGTAAGIIDV